MRNGVIVPDQVYENILKELMALLTVEEKSPTNEFIKAYCDSYKARYECYPVVDGKAAGFAKRLTKDLGVGKAIDLIQTYLEMNDQFFLTKRHDLTTFAGNLNAVAVRHNTGKSISRKQAQAAESTEQNVDAVKSYIEKKYGGNNEPSTPKRITGRTDESGS